MSRADDIIFRIGANAKPFIGAMGGAKKALGSFLAVAGAGISVSAIKSIVSEVGNIANIADKVNLTTDALQKMRFAGEQTGVATTATDVAMQRFTRRIAEAANGSGELLKTLEANNVALRNQDKTMRPQLDILKDYADLIKNADSEQAKLLLTFKAFDTEGAALVNVLGDGADGLETMFQKASDLGVVFEDDLIRQARELDDKYSALSSTMGTFFKNIVVQGAIDAEKLANKIEKVSDGEGKINLLTNRIVDLKQALALTGKDDLGLLDQMTLWVEGDADTIIAKIAEARKELSGLRALANIKDAYSNFQSTPIKPVDVKKTIIADPRTEAEKAAAKRAAEAAARKAESEARRRADSIRNVVEALKHEYENLGRTAEQQKLYNSLKRAGVELDSKAGREIAEHVKILTAEQNLLSGKAFALAEQKKQADAFKSSLDYLAQSAIDMGQGFVDGSLKGKDALKNLGIELLGVVAKAALLGQGPLAGLFGGGVNTSISPAVNSAIAAGRGGLFAKGGVSNVPAIFGEAGPEAAVPLPDGRSIPVTFSGASSQSTATSNVHVTVGISTDNNGNLTPFVEKIAKGAVGEYSAGTYERHLVNAETVDKLGHG